MINEEKYKALMAITAWRQLKFTGVLTPEQEKEIETQIMNKYGEFLSPLRGESEPLTVNQNQQ